MLANTIRSRCQHHERADALWDDMARELMHCGNAMWDGIVRELTHCGMMRSVKGERCCL